MAEETAHKVCRLRNSRAAADIQIIPIAMPLVVRLGEGAARPDPEDHPAIHRTTIVAVAAEMVVAVVVPTMIAGVVDFTTIVAKVPITTIVAVVDHQTIGTAAILREKGGEEEVVVAMVAITEMAVGLAEETIITEEEAAKTMSIAAAVGSNWE